MFVHRDFRQVFLNFADHLDIMAGQARGIDAQRVLQQVGRLDGLARAGVLREVLLRRHDFLDVLHTGFERPQLPEQRHAFGDQPVVQLFEVSGQEFPLGMLGDERAEASRMFAQQGRHPAEIGSLGLAQFFSDGAGGNVDAVDDVFDVVQHAGGGFGHAGFPRRADQFLIHPLQLGFRLLPFGDVLKRPNAPGELAGFRPQQSRL